MRPKTACASAIILILSVCGSHVAAAASDAAASASQVDPDAMAALDKMGAELRSHNNFDMKADVTREDVLKDGQKLQYAGTVEVEARRPDRFKLSVVSDLRDREIYYDGKTVTVYSPRLGYYASFDAPPTIAQTLKVATEKYGVELPLADLFTWGTDKSLEARITSAFLVRPEHIDGQLCNHYAFRQEKVDWQIWIRQDGPALPCKLVITNRVDASMPQYTSQMHWSFPTTIADDTFAFAPPANAHKIVMATLIPGRLEGATP
ncbi:MAG TPA: DUF2092 domain-containing protein [Rhizomicrobium sp.]|nr:DUF2092 domain-containing protein [Rhizomicrobium sp.]